MQKSVTEAMAEYFAKIKDISYFQPKKFDIVPPAVLEEYRNRNFLVNRDYAPDFGIVTQKFGIEVPDVIKEYYSSYHPFIAGQHKNNPHESESLILYSSDTPDIFGSLMSAAEYWTKYDIIDIGRYFPVGTVTYNDSFIVMDRATGQIFVEYSFAEDPADDEDGKLFPTPLADSLSSFICGLEPYWRA